MNWLKAASCWKRKAGAPESAGHGLTYGIEHDNGVGYHFTSSILGLIGGGGGGGIIIIAITKKVKLTYYIRSDIASSSKQKGELSSSFVFKTCVNLYAFLKSFSDQDKELPDRRQHCVVIHTGSRETICLTLESRADLMVLEKAWYKTSNLAVQRLVVSTKAMKSSKAHSSPFLHQTN